MELCGLFHAHMPVKIHVISIPEFDLAAAIYFLSATALLLNQGSIAANQIELIELSSDYKASSLNAG